MIRWSIVFLLFLPLLAQAARWQEDERIAVLFRQYGLQGTFVVYDIQKDILTGVDRHRAQTRYIPASTFKIANSLIGLDSGAVHSVDEVLPYGGSPQSFKVWEQDMSLRQAIKVSNVPIYRELARRIGRQAMQRGIDNLDYGNREIGKVVDRFWLQGPLKISAVEQTRFLARLAQTALPVDKAAQRAVQNITLQERGEGWALYAKTGWADAYRPDLGWWVGWVEREGRLYSFALNIDAYNPQQMAIRTDLGRNCLVALGILPPESLREN